jgi:hypothetical protein
MAALPHISYIDGTVRSTTSTTFVDVPSAAIASGSFIVGHDYIIKITARVQTSSVSASNVDVQTLHGTTAWTQSWLSLEPDATTAWYPYFFQKRWTAVSGEGIKLQFRTVGAATIQIDQISITVLDVTDLVEGVDFMYAEEAATTNFGTSFAAFSTLANIPADTGKWLATGFVRWQPTTLTVQPQTAMRYDGAVITQNSAEGEDATNDRYIMALVSVIDTTGKAGTEDIEVGGFVASGTIIRGGSSVFALRLGVFKQSVTTVNAALLDASGTNYATNLATATLTPDETGDVFVIGYGVYELAASSSATCKTRIQAGPSASQVDVITGTTTDARAEWEPWDSTEDGFSMQHGIISLNAVANVIDFDGSTSAAGAGRGFRDRCVCAFTLELSAAAGAEMATALTASAVMNGALTTDIRMATALTASATRTGGLTTDIRMATALAAAGFASSALTTEVRMASALLAAGVVAPALTTDIRMAAALSGVALLSPTFIIPGAEFAAALTGTATLAAALTTDIRMAAAITASATTAAALATDIRFAAQLLGSGNVLAALLTEIRLATSLLGNAQLSPSLLTGGDLATSLIGRVTMAPALTTDIRMAAILNAAGMVSANLHTDIRLVTALAGNASISPTILTDIRLATSLTGSATVNASLTTAINLATSLVASASMQGQLATDILLAATLLATASLTSAMSGPVVEMAASLVASAALSATLSDHPIGVGALAAMLSVMPDFAAALSTVPDLAAAIRVEPDTGGNVAVS